MKTCIYPGSFDPVTYGHLDIINRAAKTFDKVIVAIGMNNNKKYTFTTEHRKQLLCSTITAPNVDIIQFEGLLADYAYENNIGTIIKGVRNNQDFDYERLLHDVTISQQSGIDTHILVADQRLSHVSSTAAKELCKHQGLIHDYVPPVVKEDLEWVINNQYILGVTGEIGMGKSHISELISRLLTYELQGFVKPVLNVDLDKLVHEIYESDKPVHVSLKKQIMNQFQMKNDQFSRKELGEIVFNNTDKLKVLNEMIRVPLMTAFRKKISGFKGLILINGALLAESGYLPLCNNNVVIVKSSRSQQLDNLKKRGYDDNKISRRMLCQWDTDTKLNAIQREIDRHRYGSVIVYNNQYDDPFHKHVRNNLIIPIAERLQHKHTQYKIYGM